MLVAVAFLVCGAGGARAGDGSGDGAAAPRVDLRAELRALSDRAEWAAVLARTASRLNEAPDDVTALEFRGFAHQQTGEPSRAAVSYERLVTLRPDHAWGHARLAAVMTALDRIPLAVRSARRSVELDPSVAGTWKLLVAAHRRAEQWQPAIDAISEALDVGVDPLWCHLETAYLHHAADDPLRARSAYRRAAAAGADARTVDHGLELVDLVLAARGADQREPASGAGPSWWTFDVGGLRVESSLGPVLPARMRDVLNGARRWVALSVGPLPQGQVLVRLSRTFEEHETSRRRLFPGGTFGRAFLERRRERGASSAGGREATPVRYVVHAAWPSPSLWSSVSHELAHVALAGSPGSIPAWLDEGLATYLEFDAAGRRRDDLAAPREDLVATLRTASASGAMFEDAELFVWHDRAFRGRRARVAYAQSWSFVRFLLRPRAVKSDPDERRHRIVAAARTRSRRAVTGSPFAALDRVAAALGTTRTVLLTGWRAEVGALIEGPSASRTPPPTPPR